MTRLAAALFLLMTAGAAAAPTRIMSLKVCTDALLMELAPPSHIAFVSVSMPPAAPSGASIMRYSTSPAGTGSPKVQPTTSP